MKKSAHFFNGLLVSALLLADLTATSVMAQDKARGAKAAPAAKAEKGKPVLKELFENDRVRVLEITFKPGDEGNVNVMLPFRVIRALKGGTLMFTYTDGTTEKIEWKTGEVRAFEADSKSFTLKNVGKSDVVQYAVFLKEPKK